MPATVYKWTVKHSGRTAPLTVDAAYPVVEDGHMVLKDADHKPVFMAEPGLGCTFERRGLAAAGSPGDGE
jgi:hypothetical protein